MTDFLVVREDGSRFPVMVSTEAVMAGVREAWRSGCQVDVRASDDSLHLAVVPGRSGVVEVVDLLAGVAMPARDVDEGVLPRRLPHGELVPVSGCPPGRSPGTGFAGARPAGVP